MAGNKINVSLSIASDIKYTDLVHDVIISMGKSVNIDKSVIHWLALGAREAVNNAIQHGNKYDRTKMVTINFHYKNNNLKIEVYDEGAGFETVNLPNPLTPINLLKDHGRGVFLMRSFMDEIHFKKTKKGFCVEMSKNLNLKEAE